MLEQEKSQSTENGTVMLPAVMAEHLKTADVVIFLSCTEDGQVLVKPVVRGAAFDPESNGAHMLTAVITHELPNLMGQANGTLTDSDRYQALRQFALLAKTDKARFESVNVTLQEYEEEHKVNLAEATDPAAFDAYANFLADVLVVTHPEEVAKQPKEIVIPGSRIILPLPPHGQVNY